MTANPEQSTAESGYVDGVAPICADGIVDHADEVVEETAEGTVVECGWCGRRITETAS